VSGPRILHSTGWGDEGRHWLTIASEPPLQVGPVARNHCRIGVAILRAAWEALDRLPKGKAVPAAVDLRSGSKRVRVNLPLAQARWRGEREEPPEDPGETWFFTPLPLGPWSGTYDEWLFAIAQKLGLDPSPAAGEGGYEREMDAAYAEVQSKLPELRARYLAGLDGLELAFKVALETASDGIEWCWVLPASWQDPATLVATLESEPHDVPGRKSGDELTIAVADLVDYIIGSPSAGTVEAGRTQRIAEDYGVVI
jgi:hypothetical protein